jgi:hypothetical protein
MNDQLDAAPRGNATTDAYCFFLRGRDLGRTSRTA